jgi:hypothetical protein
LSACLLSHKREMKKKKKKKKPNEKENPAPKKQIPKLS